MSEIFGVYNTLKAVFLPPCRRSQPLVGKFLAPPLCISYMSKAWGGQASDKYITEDCGIFENLLPGNYVLADRGFDIRDSVGFYFAEVLLPSFTKGKRQLSAKDVEKCRQITFKRIHVEKVIGLLRNKYTILQLTLPLDYLMKTSNEYCTLDKIAVVCSALCNMCPSIVCVMLAKSESFS